MILGLISIACEETKNMWKVKRALALIAADWREKHVVWHSIRWADLEGEESSANPSHTRFSSPQAVFHWPQQPSSRPVSSASHCDNNYCRFIGQGIDTNLSKPNFSSLFTRTEKVGTTDMWIKSKYIHFSKHSLFPLEYKRIKYHLQMYNFMLKFWTHM